MEPDESSLKISTGPMGDTETSVTNLSPVTYLLVSSYHGVDKLSC